MKTLRILLPILGGILAACSESEPATPAASPLQTLQASIEQPAAAPAQTSPQLATLFGDEPEVSLQTIIGATPIPHPILWRQNDEICVHFDTDPEGVMRIYLLSGTGGTSAGNFTFSGSASSNPDIPYDKIPPLPDSYNTLLAGYAGRFVVITPTDRKVVIQTPTEIFQGIENIDNFPMFGRGQSGQQIGFACPFGLIHLPVSGNVAIDRIYIDTSEQKKEIVGYFVIDQNTYVPDFQEAVPISNKYIVSWASRSANGFQLSSTPESFYAILPPGTYDIGTKFQFRTTSGTTIERRTKQLFTVTRAEILNLPTVNVTQ